MTAPTGMKSRARNASPVHRTARPGGGIADEKRRRGRVKEGEEREEGDLGTGRRAAGPAAHRHQRGEQEVPDGPQAGNLDAPEVSLALLRAKLRLPGIELELGLLFRHAVVHRRKDIRWEDAVLRPGPPGSGIASCGKGERVTVRTYTFDP